MKKANHLTEAQRAEAKQIEAAALQRIKSDLALATQNWIAAHPKAPARASQIQETCDELAKRYCTRRSRRSLIKQRSPQ